jgi:hypothetical protein
MSSSSVVEDEAKEEAISWRIERSESKMIDAIVKKLMKSDNTLSQADAEKKAQEILERYREANKDRDAKRDEEVREEWEKALDREFLNLEMDHLSDD